MPSSRVNSHGLCSVLLRVLYIPFAHRYSGVRVNHTGLAFAVFPLLQPSGSGLVVVKARLLGLVVDAALRLGVKTKKPSSLTPVEERPVAEDATPFGVGIRLDGSFASASTPSGTKSASISRACQAPKTIETFQRFGKKKTPRLHPGGKSCQGFPMKRNLRQLLTAPLFHTHRFRMSSASSTDSTFASRPPFHS